MCSITNNSRAKNKPRKTKCCYVRHSEGNRISWYFNSLSNSHQKILTEEGLKAANWLYGVASESDKQKEIEAKNLGATVIKLNSNQRRIWKKKMSPVYDKLRAKIGSKFDNWMNTVENL